MVGKRTEPFIEARVVTVDGPSASGKTSVSRAVANNLSWNWVSTGVFYRGLGYMAWAQKVDPNDEEKLLDLLNLSEWKVTLSPQVTEFWYQGKDVTSKIFAEQIGSLASQVARWPRIRQRLLEAQRDCAKGVVGLVAEGRDCGTQVFPEAWLKIFLTAGAENRAARRAEEQGLNVGETLQAQKLRDAQDSNRQDAPLAVADGAIEIDTTSLGLEEVISQVTGMIEKKMESEGLG